MKKILTIVLLISTLSCFSQISNDEDYYYETYLYEQYRLEKQRLVWTIVGSTAIGLMGGRDYIKYGNNYNIYTSGFSFTISGYSVYKLITLKKEIKDYQKSKQQTPVE